MICRISRFGRNSVLAGILFAQWRTTLAHVFTSEGKHSGSENADGWVESCSEGRGEYHTCLAREISLYPLQNYLATDSIMSAMHLQIFFDFSIVLWYQKIFFSFISVSNAPIIWQQSLSMQDGAFFTHWKNALITLIHESYRKLARKFVNQMKSYSRSNWLIVMFRWSYVNAFLCIIGCGILEELVTVVQTLDCVLSL